MGNNCAASTSIGCLLCFQLCNAEKIRNAFLFLPPAPSYTIEHPDGSKYEGSEGVERGGKIAYLSATLREFPFYREAAAHAEVITLRTMVGERIPIVWVKPSGASSASQPPAKEPPFIILHCHGNATDIGIMMGVYFEMSKQLGVEVVGVEYSGYGQSTGAPSCPGLYHDIEAAYNYVVAQGVPPERLVAYGQSVGSGPVLHIASKFKLGGVVLHSGYLSAISVIDPRHDRCCKPSCVFCSCDYYQNYKKIRNVKCPAFVIHGQSDDIVPFHHGVKLSDNTPQNLRWPGYFPNFGHNDLVEQDAASYFQQVSKFLRSVRERSGYSPSGGTHEKVPMQVEMTEGGCILGAREDDRQPQAWETGDGYTLSYPEPAAGPEDGRYGALRRDRNSPDAGGNARTLQPVPLVGSGPPPATRGSSNI